MVTTIIARAIAVAVIRAAVIIATWVVVATAACRP
jgi:hypothetical protein